MEFLKKTRIIREDEVASSPVLGISKRKKRKVKFMDNGYLFAGIVILILFTSILSRFINSVRYSKKIKAQITRRWGREPEKVKPEKLKSIATYFNDTSSENPQRHIIDNITWNDLDMDRIFTRINNTGSSVGEEYLYSLLRKPIFDVETLKERGRLIDFFP